MRNNTLIFGDSYSTFAGFIPEGYAAYYTEDDTLGTGVVQVSQTWWYQVADEANLNLVLNNSWSGSTIGYTGYENKDCSQSSSFIFRLRQLIANGFFAENKIDTVLVFGGTNDSWSNAPLGEEKYSDWEEKDFYCVLPAICYFVKLLKETLPQAKIYCLMNTEIKPEIIACLQTACEKYHTIPVAFTHIDKVGGHPTVQGMKDIKESVLKTLSL